MSSRDKIFIYLALVSLLQTSLGQDCFEKLQNKTFIREVKLRQGYPLDSLLNFTELSSKYGYSSQEHNVTTEDGYILTIFRMKGKNCQGPVKNPPVLLMHDLLMSSDSWLDSGPKSGLAYLLSDACYDLWVGNVRGNYYGKKHQTLNPETDIDFWQFTVNEIGTYDLPATIDYILQQTSSDQINYIGYSQGASTYFIMCSERNGYSDKVSLFIGLEPDSKNTYTKSILWRLTAEAYQFFYPHLTEVGLYEALPLGGLFQSAAAYVCKDSIMADSVCRVFLSLLDSLHLGSVETETIQVLFGHFPAGTSVKNMIWYSQSLNVDEFQKFDYGNTANMELYNSTIPPPYNLNETTTPTVVINGINDFLTAPADIDWLINQLPNVLEHYLVQDPMWNHLDVPYSQFTSEKILSKITQYLDKYSGSSEQS